jgi:membrane fusion protein, multidrug efflux system
MKRYQSIYFQNLNPGFNIKTGFVLLVLFFSACGNPDNSDTIEEKQKQLNEYKQEMTELKKKITALETEIAGIQNGNELLVPVVIDTIKKGDYNNRADFQGVVEAENNVTMSAENGGTVTQILVKEGQKVAKGQLLVKLDASILEAQADEIANAMDLARITFEKQERLWKQKIGSEIQYLEAKNRKESLEKQMQSIRTRMAKYYLTAPFDGTIDRVYINQGQMTAPGSPVVQVVDASKIKIVSEVPERYIGVFKVGDSVLVKYPGLKLESMEVIDAIGASVNADNRTFNLFIRPKNIESKLKANVLAIISAVDYQAKDAIIIPTRIVKKDPLGNAYVFVAEQDGHLLKVRKKQVEVERYFAALSIIKSGLNEGELIIVKGHNSVDVNDNLQPVNDSEI